jgi:hypothetical protein
LPESPKELSMTFVSQASPAAPRAAASPNFLRKIIVDPWLFGIFAIVTLSVLVFAALPIFTVMKQAVITENGFNSPFSSTRCPSPLYGMHCSIRCCSA